jgi:uncharacterized protein involved in exopolysaccharide biosynthesis
VVIEKGRFIMLGGLLIGIGLAAVYYYQSPKYYKGTMLLTSTKLHKKTFANIIEQLSSIAGASESLSKELNLSKEAASQIRFFDSRNLLDEPLKEDTSTKFNQPFKIIVGLSQADSIDRLQNAILLYLNNRPHLKLIREQEARIYADKLKQLDRGLAQIDSLETEFNKFLATSKTTATVYTSAINPAEIYEQSISLMREKENAERQLTIDNNAVLLLDGFKPSPVARPSSLVRLAFLAGTLGIVIGFIIAFLIETRKKVLPQS